MEFQEFPKIARLSRECTITEKIDGTNAQVCIVALDGYPAPDPCIHQADGLALYAGSRTRWITPADDNHGFARWCVENGDELLKLGVGRHFGEWWGGSIQKRYGQFAPTKRLSLFNTSIWSVDVKRPACCDVVPVLYQGEFDTSCVEGALGALRKVGSIAAPGCMRPEGVIIYHHAAGEYFKKTIERDMEWKGKAAAA